VKYGEDEYCEHSRGMTLALRHDFGWWKAEIGNAFSILVVIMGW